MYNNDTLEKQQPLCQGIEQPALCIHCPFNIIGCSIKEGGSNEE